MVLEDRNESCRIIDEIQIKNQIGSDESNEGKNKSSANKLQQTRVQNDKNCNSGRLDCQKFAATQTFECSKAERGCEMLPSPRNDCCRATSKARYIILHVGTNNATNIEASEIFNDIDNYAKRSKILFLTLK